MSLGGLCVLTPTPLGSFRIQELKYWRDLHEPAFVGLFQRKSSEHVRSGG